LFLKHYSIVKNEQTLIEGNSRMETQKRFEIKNEGLAAVLSLMLPGVGQFYTGHFIWGIIWFIITPGLWLGSGGTLGWIFHIFSAIQAHRQAKRQNFS
jgi:TM2 domain-containing membrane protein YozV